MIEAIDNLPDSRLSGEIIGSPPDSGKRHTQVYELEDGCDIIIVYNFLSQSKRRRYLRRALREERTQWPFYNDKMLPRRSVIYSKKGDGWIYSNSKHPSVKYPDYVLRITSKMERSINKIYPENPCGEISYSSSIVYDSEYERGGGIGAHGDFTNEGVWDNIAILNHGQTRWFRVRNVKTREFYNIRAVDNSLIVMHGDTFQQKYTHQVDKLPKSVEVHTRLSLNIRWLSSEVTKSSSSGIEEPEETEEERQE